MIDQGATPIGVVLAGGGGRRIGGSKAAVVLAGRPLISYPLAALKQVVEEIAVVAKEGTELPPLPDGIAVWIEPSTPRHPVVGIVEALTRAGERPVLVVGCDMPLLDAKVLSALARSDRGRAAAVIAVSDGMLEPLLGRYHPPALAQLRAAAVEAPLREIVAGLDPRRLDVPAEVLFNVNSPSDLARAEELLRNQPNVKS